MLLTDDERPPLPPEMYINQKKWLELRATRRSGLISCLCNNINIVSWMIQFFFHHHHRRSLSGDVIFLYLNVIPSVLRTSTDIFFLLYIYAVTANVTISPLPVYYFLNIMLCLFTPTNSHRRWWENVALTYCHFFYESTQTHKHETCFLNNIFILTPNDNFRNNQISINFSK